ncbi:LacI family DNA-binding transcriptional regulator [Streptomyces sp. Tu 3180]|uniref:LacI family DNA-binding transcriptional regulator n=1 Tax=Streptomyces sp. Tu 3180 TaxID=2682611 RepID=UPI00140AABB0|nr:LacI family DNA-binding transcriptional regulator [Streptomyces sp. Tu 3180]KAF3467958.1 LacI family transcriptional regulator [Streptomyces sp. Tu 3180]
MHDDDGVGARVTLAEVAKEAGVSLPTVSKVLNGRSDVSRATRARIEQLLEAHGYRRRNPRAPRSPLVELVFHELDSVWAMEIVRGAEDVAQENRATVVLTRSGTRHAPAPDWIEGVLRRRPLGVVLVFSSLPEDVKRQLGSQGIPFVIIDPAGDPDPGVPSVGSANWAGGLAATRHLTDHGHRRIAIITGPEDMLCSLARLDGYRSAMAMAGLPIDPRLVRFGDFHVQGGFEHAMDLLDGPDRPTAVFAGSDLQALGVLEAARLRNLRVPEDLSVVGYDDVPLAQWASPPLTTVHQPLRRMAEEAIRMLLSPDDPGKAAQRIELATHLVARQSTAPYGGGPGRRPREEVTAAVPAAGAPGARRDRRGGEGG